MSKNEAVVVTDLFGDAVTLPSGRRGRPSHRWTKANGDKVILGLAMGYKDAEIAFGLGISVPTLRKHYFTELKRREMQRTRFDLWRAHTLAEQAAAGNVGAMKALEKMVEKRDLERAAARARDAESDAPEDEPVGKKIAAQRRAEEAASGSDAWGGDLNPGGGYH